MIEFSNHQHLAELRNKLVLVANEFIEWWQITPLPYRDLQEYNNRIFITNKFIEAIASILMPGE